ncbi:hypothetical protein ABT120_58660 [Nonomuraea angiospora]
MRDTWPAGTARRTAWAVTAFLAFATDISADAFPNPHHPGF